MANHSDPTANTAIGNVMRSRVRRSALAPMPSSPQKPRQLTREFPAIFAGLLPHEARVMVIKAFQLAGDVDKITREDLEQAKAMVGGAR